MVHVRGHPQAMRVTCVLQFGWWLCCPYRLPWPKRVLWHLPGWG